MTADELRAAAVEYHHRIYRGRLGDPHYRDHKWYGEDVVAAFLAGAEFSRVTDSLSRPADDGEEIGPGWLELIGFEADPNHGSDGYDPPVWVYRDGHGAPLVTLDCIDTEPGQWDVYFGEMEDWSQFPRPINTRSHLRHLMAALGIPLTESGAS